MNGSTIRQGVELESLLAAVAGSEIRVTSASRPARHFADWCEMQKPADIDDVILVWLRSQAAPRSPAALS